MFEHVPLPSDETSLHNQAAVLRVTLDNMDQGLVMTDPVGRVVICNKRAIALLNLPLALMASHPRVEEVVAYQLRHGEPPGIPADLTVQSIQEQTRPDGTALEIRCVPLPEGGVVCTYTDVTERRASAEQLRIARDAAELAREEAEAASRAKTDFLAAMSHEIRTPLNAIIGFADLLAESGRLQTDLQRNADIIRSSGHALLTVVNDILDFSKVEAGKIVLAQTSFAPIALMEDCIAIVRGNAIQKALAIDLRVDPGLPEVLIGDEARLRQVLLNLLNNAVKFTAAGSVTLEVRCERTGTEDQVFRFSVKDTGIGIPKDKQGRLFQVFSQVDNSIERNFGGTGLGLAICLRLVQLMGGTIGVESEAGSGAEFWFRIALPVGAVVAPAPESVSVAVGVTPRRLLLVEDVEVNQILARTILESAGHSVDIAADGEAAVEAVRDRLPYDLVLMDVQMHGMDGLAATRLIRALPGARARTPIIAMTANVLPEQVRQFRDAGMDDCIGKPYKRADLFAAIERCLSEAHDTERAAPSVQRPAALDQGVDRTTFEQLVELMGAATVGGLLAQFAVGLESCLILMTSRPPARAEIRRQVHDLVAALGLLGISGLGQVFAEILAYDDERSLADGEAGFVALLARAERLGSGTHAAILRLAAELRGPDPTTEVSRSGSDGLGYH